MSLRTWLMALTVVLIWGMNFIVIKLGVTGMPPFLLAGIRFVVILFPAIFFVKPPKVSWKLVALYGMLVSFGQFSLLFTAIRLGMPAGISSLLVQSQAFFTILLATSIGERIHFYNIIGMVLAGIGIYLVGVGGMSGVTANGITALTLFLTLAAAFCWGAGNLVNKLIMRQNPETSGLSLVIWGGILPGISFFICSWLFEGKTQIIDSLSHIQLSTIFAILYMAYVSSITGWLLWATLMGKHAGAKIAPLTLLAPIISIIAAAFIFAEYPSPLQIVGAIITLLGFIINMIGKNIWLKYKKRTDKLLAYKSNHHPV